MEAYGIKATVIRQDQLEKGLAEEKKWENTEYEDDNYKASLVKRLYRNLQGSESYMKMKQNVGISDRQYVKGSYKKLKNYQLSNE